jgi:hypothetical protein
MANVSQAYHWFILRIVMPLGVSCTVVIHVGYGKLWSRLTADCVVVMHVHYASCEAVRQYTVISCQFREQSKLLTEMLDMTWELLPEAVGRRQQFPSDLQHLIYMHLTTNPLKMIMSAYHTWWPWKSAWQEWCTAHRSRAWNSSDPEVGEQSTASLYRLFLNFSL